MKQFILALLFVSFSSQAGEIQLDVYGRKYINSCSYITNVTGDYSINFRNAMLPWGTRIFVITGWKGFNYFGGKNDYGFEWAHREEIEAVAVAPFQWRAEIHRVLHERSKSETLNHLQFSIRVEEPGKMATFYPAISWAFYEVQVALDNFVGTPCVSGGELPPYEHLQQRIRERH